MGTSNVTLESLGLVANSIGDASANVTAWTNNVLPVLQAGGHVCHDELTFYIDDALPGPLTRGWCYETTPASRFIQTTDDTPILLFDCTTTDAPDYFYLGGFRAEWVNDQPDTNTLAAGVLFACNGNNGSGVHEAIFGPNFILANGRDGIAIHPATVTAQYNFPIWGCMFIKPVMAQQASGSLLRIGNFGSSGGAPANIVHSAYLNALSSTDYTIPLIHLRSISGACLINTEINNLRANAVYFENCDSEVMIAPLFEVITLDTANIGVVRTSGTRSRLRVTNPRFQSVTINLPNTNDRDYLFTNFGGEMTVENLSLISLTPTKGTLTGLWPRNSGHAANLGRPFLESASGFDLFNPSDAASISGRGAQSMMFILNPMPASRGGAAVEPIRSAIAPTSGFIKSMQYEFISSADVPVAVTAGSGQVGVLKNGSTVSGTVESFNSTTNATGHTKLLAASIAFETGDKLQAYLSTDAALAPTTSIARVTLNCIYW